MVPSLETVGETDSLAKSPADAAELDAESLEAVGWTDSERTRPVDPTEEAEFVLGTVEESSVLETTSLGVAAVG